MGASSLELNRLSVVWRRKWIIIATVVIIVGATEVVSHALTKIYSTSATLIIAQPGRAVTFDTAQANEEAARSYARILGSPNFASQVASQVGSGTTRSSISSQVSIQAVPNTALMTITAENANPALAKRIADTYASVFVTYAPQLTPQTKATVTLADSAPLPTSPARPKPTLYSLAAAIVGVMAGIGLAFVRERYDIRIRSLEDLTAHVQIPVLASIPVRSSARSMLPFAEAFRLLRTALRFTDQGGAVRTIAVTSWSEGEGKTTLSSQLAQAVSSGGTNTLAVDGDAHRPGLQATLIPNSGTLLEPGFSDYIMGSSGFEECVYETRIPTLDLMPPGRHVPTLSSLLETRRGRGAFAELGQHRDVLIVDCPPLAVGADAPTIASQVDGVILVVDLRRATKWTLDRAIRQLERVNAAILGIVVNRDRDHQKLSYYGYKSNRANGAADGEDEQQPSRARRMWGRHR